MTKLNNIYLYKFLICYILTIIINNIYVSLILAIYLLTDNIKVSIIYIVSIILFYLFNLYRYDIIPIGIVEYTKSNYLIVNKLLYKAKILNDSTLKVGDVILSLSSNIDSSDIDAKNNILFYINDFKYLFNIVPKNFVFNKINSLDDNIKDIIIKMFYNQNNYNSELSFIFSYSIVLYYFLKRIIKTNPLKIIFIIIHSLLFNFELKFLFIIIDIIINKREYNLIFKVLFISLLNYNLFYNYSLLLPLLFEIYYHLNLKLDFKIYSSIIFSFCFSEINILYSFFYKELLFLRIILMILGLLAIFIKPIGSVIIYILKFITYINIEKYNIRGKITFIGLFIYLLTNKYISNRYLKIILLYLFIICPLFKPFPLIEFIDVGQGDSMLINDSFNAKTVLIDTGNTYNYYKLKRSLYRHGIYTIDYLIISHDDSDHSGNIANLKNDFNIKEIITEGKDIKLNSIFLKHYNLGEYDNDNDNSLVYSTDINDISFLFTGDISKYAEYDLINKYGSLDIDVLKASHHGSDTGNSDYLVSNILPTFAIISTSGMYNHPSPKTIEIFKRYNVKYYLTKECGNIVFYFSKLGSILKTDNNQFVIIK